MIICKVSGHGIYLREINRINKDQSATLVHTRKKKEVKRDLGIIIAKMRAFEKIPIDFDR